MKTHTFGGRYFDRFIDFEVDPGSGGGDGVGGLDGSEVAPAAAPVDPAAAVEPPAEVVPPAPLTSEDIIAAARVAAAEGSGEAFRQMMATMEAEEAARRAAVPAELPEWDPYDPQSIMAHVVRGLTPLFRELEAKANAGADVAAKSMHEQGKQEAHAFLDRMIAGDTARGVDPLGEFDKDRAIAGARMLMMVDNTISPEDALKQAAKAEVDYADSLVARRMEALGIVAENHRGVAPEVGSGAAAAGEVSRLPRGRNAYTVQLERSLANRGLRPGVTASP